MEDFPFWHSKSKAVPYASSWLHLNRRFVSLILSYYFYFRVYSCFSSIAFLTMMWVPVVGYLICLIMILIEIKTMTTTIMMLFLVLTVSRVSDVNKTRKRHGNDNYATKNWWGRSRNQDVVSKHRHMWTWGPSTRMPKSNYFCKIHFECY